MYLFDVRILPSRMKFIPRGMETRTCGRASVSTFSGRTCTFCAHFSPSQFVVLRISSVRFTFGLVVYSEVPAPLKYLSNSMLSALLDNSSSLLRIGGTNLKTIFRRQNRDTFSLIFWGEEEGGGGGFLILQLWTIKFFFEACERSFKENSIERSAIEECNDKLKNGKKEKRNILERNIFDICASPCSLWNFSRSRFRAVNVNWLFEVICCNPRGLESFVSRPPINSHRSPPEERKLRREAANAPPRVFPN